MTLGDEDKLNFGLYLNTDLNTHTCGSTCSDPDQDHNPPGLDNFADERWRVTCSDSLSSVIGGGQLDLHITPVLLFSSTSSSHTVLPLSLDMNLGGSKENVHMPVEALATFLRTKHHLAKEPRVSDPYTYNITSSPTKT